MFIGVNRAVLTTQWYKDLNKFSTYMVADTGLRKRELSVDETSIFLLHLRYLPISFSIKLYAPHCLHTAQVKIL